MEQDHLVRRPVERPGHVGADPRDHRVGPAPRHQVLGRRPTPAWLLSLHRYLGALTVVFLGVHVGAILLDTYTDFSIMNVLVPFTGSWHRWPWPGASSGCTSSWRSRSRHCCATECRSGHGTPCISSPTSCSPRRTVHMLTAGTDVKAVVASTRRGAARRRRGVRIGRALHVAARRGEPRRSPRGTREHELEKSCPPRGLDYLTSRGQPGEAACRCRPTNRRHAQPTPTPASRDSVSRGVAGGRRCPVAGVDGCSLRRASRGVRDRRQRTTPRQPSMPPPMNSERHDEGDLEVAILHRRSAAPCRRDGHRHATSARRHAIGARHSPVTSQRGPEPDREGPETRRKPSIPASSWWLRRPTARTPRARRRRPARQPRTGTRRARALGHSRRRPRRPGSTSRSG